MRVSLRLVLIVILQTLVLVSMVGMKQWTLNTGTPIVLETRPIDPRSLFRGDYVRLNYSINTLHTSDLWYDRDFKKHERIYVLLRKGDPYWQPVSVHHERPVIAPDHVAIKGRVRSVGQKLWNRELRSWEDIEYVGVRYGIENYFVPEGAGRTLERPRADEKISMRVAVDKFGNAGIKAVLVNGHPRYTETLF